MQHQQETFTKSRISNQQENTNLIWKHNDSKAQKNGPHSNIYWVKVLLLNHQIYRNNH